MSSNQDNDDDSFILILGTSPEASMNSVKCNGTPNGDILQKSQIEDAMKDLPQEANLAFKAQFQLGESPSPASLMVASTLITDDRSTQELQQRFGELLDENVVLKETLRQNNESMREQFLLIASCQEDMLRTHRLHREKFDETRDLVDRLRKENKQLKLDITRVDAEPPSVTNSETGESKDGPPSGLEFVTSPEDDTIDKLTSQLELVEKQRRQVIVDNEKLTWQKESLEHIVDATSRERDELKEKLKDAELKLINSEAEHSQEVSKLHGVIGDLQEKAKHGSGVSASAHTERGRHVQELQGKVAALQGELKEAQLRILEQEDVKLELYRHKSGAADAARVYSEQLQELRDRLKLVQTTVFQPVAAAAGAPGSECGSYMSNVKLYDRTLKHLADYLNGLVNGFTDGWVKTLALLSSAHDSARAADVRAGLLELRATLERQHRATVSFAANIRGTLSIFEGIFKDYNELLKKTLTKTDSPQNVEQLTSALLARAQEISLLQAQVAQLTTNVDDTELLRAQVDAYRTDFEAERESREKMASEKVGLETDLRTAQRQIVELTTKLAEAQKKPGVRIVTKPAAASAAPRPARDTPTRPAPSTPASGAAAGSTVRKKKKVEKECSAPREVTPPPLRFDCPVCDQPFKSLILLQQHVDTCLM